MSHESWVMMVAVWVTVFIYKSFQTFLRNSQVRAWFPRAYRVKLVGEAACLEARPLKKYNRNDLSFEGSCLKRVEDLDCPCSSRTAEGKGVNKGMSAFLGPPNPVVYHHDHHLSYSFYLQGTDVYQEQPGESLIFKSWQSEDRVTTVRRCKLGSPATDKRNMSCCCLDAAACRERGKWMPHCLFNPQ